MATEHSPTPRLPRLNPFAFPSDTDFRFLLLIVAVLGSSLFVYSWLYLYFPGNAEHANRILAHCSAGQPVAVCAGPLLRARSAWMFCGTALVLAVAGGIYWLFRNGARRSLRAGPMMRG